MSFLVALLEIKILWVMKLNNSIFYKVTSETSYTFPIIVFSGELCGTVRDIQELSGSKRITQTQFVIQWISSRWHIS
jgi:hypothetical protein